MCVLHALDNTGHPAATGADLWKTNRHGRGLMATSYIDGGDKLTSALRQISSRLGKRRTLNVGFLEDAKYPDGTSVASVAAFQEFGTPSAKFPIPPRPFFRTMVAKESGGWPYIIQTQLLNANYDVDKTLDILGQVIKGQLQQSIIDTLDPPLSAVTLMLRSMKAANPNLKVSRVTVYQAIQRVKAGQAHGVSGTGAKPLVESGHLLNSVDWEIK